MPKFANNKNSELSKAYAFMKEASSATFVLIAAVALSACSTVPGFKTGEMLEQSTQLYKTVDGIPTRQLQGTSVYYTQSGVKVVATRLNANNIPTIADEVSDRGVLSLVKRAARQDYRLAAGDVLTLNLWNYPEITPPSTSVSQSLGHAIDQRGYVNLPLIGDTSAAGYTLHQLQRRITEKYSRYLKHPNLSLRVLKYNGKRFYVGGQVKKPGEFILSDQPANLMTAISQAGGSLQTSDMNNIVLTRKSRNYHISLPELKKLSISPTHIPIYNHDVITVGNIDTRKVFLMGAASRPKALVLPSEGMNLSQVLSEGEGIDERTAKPSSIFVLRDTNHKNTMNIYRADLGNIDNLALASRFQLQPNDIVFVDATGLAKWNRVISLILPSASAIRTTQVISNN